jgi:hypothetical protein
VNKGDSAAAAAAEIGTGTSNLSSANRPASQSGSKAVKLRSSDMEMDEWKEIFADALSRRAQVFRMMSSILILIYYVFS